MGLVINLFISAVAVFISAYLLPGVHLESFVVALIVAVVLGIANAIIKPILLLLTLPITIITLGLFTLVINALMISLTDILVRGFQVENFWWALLFSLLLSLVNSVLNAFTDR